MRLETRLWKTLAILGFVLAMTFATIGGAAAGYVQGCAPGADACIVVNSNDDTVSQNGKVTLREALHIVNGDIALDALTGAEAKQVFLATESGLSGVVDINFDPNIFCDGCETRVIELQPPGLGGADAPAYTGAKTLALPPGLGGADALPPGLGGADDLPPGLGGADRIGKGVDGTELDVILDGSALTADYVGLWFPGGGEVIGLHFQGFSGHAIEVDAAADPVLDVTFDGNGADLVVLD